MPDRAPRTPASFEGPTRFTVVLREGFSLRVIEVDAERLTVVAGQWMLDGKPILLEQYSVAARPV